MAALREALDEVTRKNKSSTHIDLGQKRMAADEKDVETMVACLEEWIPNLWEKDQPLINIATGNFS